MAGRYKALILILLTAGVLLLGGCSLFQSDRPTQATLPQQAATVSPTAAASQETSPAPAEEGYTVTLPLTLSEARLSAWNEALERAQSRIETMDDRTLLLQLMVLYPEVIGTDVPSLKAESVLLSEYPVGGLLLRSQNVDSKAQLRELTGGLQAAAQTPLLILAEEEGGRNVTVRKKLELSVIGNMFSYRGDGLARAYANAWQLADDLVSNGINTDLAPVADVWSELTNRAIGDRAYSDDFQKAAALVREAVKGFRDRNVICTLKHFPGLGEAELSVKKAKVAELDKDKASLLKDELLPFAAGIEAGADMVMIANARIPQLDETNAAPFSYAVVTLLSERTSERRFARIDL